MNEKTFWQIIELSRSKAKHDDAAFVELLSNELAKLEPTDLFKFSRIFWKFYLISFRADLWGAAYIMNGGCSHDCFDYFRGWLISQGQKVFDAALENPDSLAEILPEDTEHDVYELEEMLYVEKDVWCKKTGLKNQDFYNQLGKLESSPSLGEFEWSDGEGDISDDQGKRLYPKLWKKFDWQG